MHSLAVALVVMLAPSAALRLPGPLSPRNANYRIEASLDTATKTVRGHAHLSWRNPAASAAGELVFHLYMNAFRNDASTFFKESHGRHRRSSFSGAHGWGAIDVTRLTVDGVELTAALRVDDTLGTVSLPKAIAAGGSAEIEIDFTTRLPRVFARTGWAEDFFAVAQWFPKIAVFDGKWRANQLHLNSEFFADFGVYDVQLDVPEGWLVGTVGKTNESWVKDKRSFVRCHAEDVHDFAWFASPRFVEQRDHYDDALGAVELRLLLWPGNEANARRHLAAAKIGLAELARRYEPYPYSQITIVDVPEDAEGAGGMEYPTLFTTESFPLPDGIHLPEWVTIHELSHQYFQGIVASDEAEEAWLDEGLTETMTDWGLSRQFGRATALYDFLGHRLSYSDASRLAYSEVADLDPPETLSFAFVDNGAYSAITYSKTDLILRTAEALIGDDKFEAGMRRYYQGAKFTHPRRADFVRLFAEGSGVDLSRFWHDTLETSERVDYRLLSVSAEQIHGESGLQRGDGGVETEVSPSPEPNAPWRSEVVVHRAGTIALPVEVRVVFDDGSERREVWSDAAEAPRWHRYVYETARPVAFAEVDPDGKLALDAARLDNGRRREPDGAPRRRILGGWQRWLSIALAMVGF